MEQGNCIPGTDIERPKVRLTGSDGNALAIVGKVKRALERAGADRGVADTFVKEALSGDYNHVLTTAMRYADCC